MKRRAIAGLSLWLLAWVCWATAGENDDYRFPSRNQSPDAFVHEFLETLRPGVIPRRQFIQWRDIRQRVDEMMPSLRALQSLAARQASFTDDLTTALLAAKDSVALLNAAFLLIGHTRQTFVTFDDDLDLKELSVRLARHDAAAARQTAEALTAVGLGKVLAAGDLKAVATGVLIGLETHRRKNLGGKSFVDIVRLLLQRVIDDLKRQGFDAKLAEELTIPYADGSGRKRVDFAILTAGQPRIGIEVNFYTTSGSKPSEIKRSYADVRKRLAATGVQLAWITDGLGYQRMRRSLRDAYLVHPNIYNFAMASRHWSSDFAAYLKAPLPHNASPAGPKAR